MLEYCRISLCGVLYCMELRMSIFGQVGFNHQHDSSGESGALACLQVLAFWLRVLS